MHLSEIFLFESSDFSVLLGVQVGLGRAKRAPRFIRSQLSAAPPNVWIRDKFTSVIRHQL